MTMTISQKQENILKHDNLTDLRGIALSQHSNRYSSLKRSDSASYSIAARPYRRSGSEGSSAQASGNSCIILPFTGTGSC